MQNYNIIVTGSVPNLTNPNDSSLTLSDNGQTNVDPGDTVTWKIGNNSGVGSFSTINDDISSVDVFGPNPSDNPSPQGNSGNWRGNVNPNIAKNTMENYTICWMASDGTGPYCFDPVIKVNP